MDTALRVKTTVKDGGKIEILAPELPAGEPVEVIILRSQPLEGPRRSVVDILASAPGQRLFRTAEEVDEHLRAERDSWER